MINSSRNLSEEPYDSNKWLKKLQQESWELELLVSGFSILLLVKGIDWLTNYRELFEASLNFQIEFANVLIVFLAIVILAIHALVINLVIHLLFRGFWVGIVGLGSVAPKTDILKLRYRKFFTEKLQKNVTSLDDLVIKVDRISSVVFAFAFLVIFLLISIALFFTSLIIIGTLGKNFVEAFSGNTAEILSYIVNGIVITYLFFGVLYLIDFLTLGFIKKIKYLDKIYYPFYKYFGWITLSFIYRTIYYNLISRFTKKRTALILVPYLIVLVTIPGMKLDHHIYYPDSFSEHKFPSNYYEESRGDDEPISVSIPSYVIDRTFIPLFIVYDPNDNSVIKEMCPEFKPKKKEGINMGIRIQKIDKQLTINYSKRTNEPYPEKSLECLSSFYTIQMNGNTIIPDAYYFHTMSKRRGIITMLTMDTLPSGRNEITVFKQAMKKDSSFQQIEYASIPFWKQ